MYLLLKPIGCAWSSITFQSSTKHDLGLKFIFQKTSSVSHSEKHLCNSMKTDPIVNRQKET